MIGLIMGSAAIAQILAALLAGALLDRVGGVQMLFLAACAYIAASLVLAMPGASVSDGVGPYFAARALQGVGYAWTLPAALTLVPRLLPPNRHGFGLGFVSAAGSLTVVIVPSASLGVLASGGMQMVAFATVALLLLGMLTALSIPLAPSSIRPAQRHKVGSDVARSHASEASSRVHSSRPVHRILGLAFRRTWLSPLSIICLYAVYWGVLIAFLAPQAARAGADIGLFFVVDGAAIIASRLITGWLTDRMGGLSLLFVGLAMVLCSILTVWLPISTLALVISGSLDGMGGGLLMTLNLMELSRRSDDGDRGAAFSLFSVGVAAGMAIGSVGSAPIVALWGFRGGLFVAAVSLFVAAFIVVRDARSWGTSPNAVDGT
jgi:MFS family permease